MMWNWLSIFTDIESSIIQTVKDSLSRARTSEGQAVYLWHSYVFCYEKKITEG